MNCFLFYLTPFIKLRKQEGGNLSNPVKVQFTNDMQRKPADMQLLNLFNKINSRLEDIDFGLSKTRPKIVTKISWKTDVASRSSFHKSCNTNKYEINICSILPLFHKLILTSVSSARPVTPKEIETKLWTDRETDITTRKNTSAAPTQNTPYSYIRSNSDIWRLVTVGLANSYISCAFSEY